MKTTFPEDTIVAEYFSKILHQPETINFANYLFYMGCKAAFQLQPYLSTNKSYKVSCNAEDVDWFARGFVSVLMGRYRLFCAARWVIRLECDSRHNIFTIGHTYDDPVTPSDYDLIYLKPFFHDAAEIRSPLLHELDIGSPERMWIVSIAASVEQYQNLWAEFPNSLAEALSLYAFVDSLPSSDGGPGVGLSAASKRCYEGLELDHRMGTPMGYLPTTILNCINA